MKYKNMNGMAAGIPNSVRRGVYKRDGWRCALCDSTDGLQIHHVRPRGMGGGNSPMNLITLCWRCHAAAHGSILQADPWVAAEYKGRQDGDMAAAVREMMDDMEQACVEYVSDYYAEQGKIWYPWDESAGTWDDDEIGAPGIEYIYK